MKYSATQVGWIVIGIFISTICFLFLSYKFQWGNPPTLNSFRYFSLTILILLLLFYKLTIKLDESDLKIIFGIGIIRFKFKIDKLIEARIIKIPWYYGLGIRITSQGLLLNIQYGEALEIKYISRGKSKILMIGLANPQELKNALEGHHK